MIYPKSPLGSFIERCSKSFWVFIWSKSVCNNLALARNDFSNSVVKVLTDYSFFFSIVVLKMSTVTLKPR
jgi:hypothetical protein